MYRELFELELSYASIIKERRRILGLDNTGAEKSVEIESISETKLSIPQLPGEGVEDDANTNKMVSNKNISQDDAKMKMIQGTLALIVFNNAIQKTAFNVLPIKMYDYYLKFLLSYGNGKEIEECFHLLEIDNKITLEQYGEWIRTSSRFNNVGDNNNSNGKSKRKKLAKKNVNTKRSLNAIDIAQKSVDKYPKEATSWLYLVDVMLHNLQYDSTPNALNKLEEIFQEATNKILPTSENAINIDVKWMQFKDAMKGNLNEISKHIVNRLRNGNLENENKIKLSQTFIDLIVENKEEKDILHKFMDEIISKNEKLNPIFLVCPWEIYKMAIYTEMTINGLNANVTFIRKLFENAVVNNANNEEMWLDYIRFESQNPGDVSNVTRITWRAKQNLTNKDEFEENLSKMQSGLL